MLGDFPDFGRVHRTPEVSTSSSLYKVPAPLTSPPPQQSSSHPYVFVQAVPHPGCLPFQPTDQLFIHFSEVQDLQLGVRGLP